MLRKIYAVSFIFSFSVALITYVNSSLLAQLINEKLVGIIYVLASIISLTMLGLMPKIVRKFGAKKTLILFLKLNIIASLLFVLGHTNLIKIIGFFALFSTISLCYFCFDLFIEHFSKTSNTGHNRGLYLVAVNSGWLLAPLLSGKFITLGGFNFAYYAAEIVTFITLLLVLIFIKKYQDPKYSHKSFIKSFKSAKANTGIRLAVLLNLALQLFYAFMVIYTPIYLNEYFGLGWQSIGIVFSIMLSAFVIFQYPVGVLTDKGIIKNRHALSISSLIMMLSLVFLYFAKANSSIITIGAILFLSRMGAAIYEASTEYFFFKQSTDSDTNFISLYRNMSPLSYVIAPLFGTLILRFDGIKNIFIILALFLFVFCTIILNKIKTYEKTI